MPTHEHQAELANKNSKLGLEGKDSARIEVQLSTDKDYQPQYALGDIYNADWNIAAAVGANEVQTLQIADGTGGTFTITFTGQTTAAIAHDATAAAVQAALNELSNVTPGDIRVTKAGTTADHTYTLKYDGQYARENVAAVTIADSFTAATDVNEVQAVAVNATGGTFTVTYAGQTTAAIAFDATGAAVTAAMVALSNIASGDVVVTGGPGGAGGATPYVFTFGGTLAATDVAEVTTGAGSLTGAPATATPSTTTPGVNGAVTATIATTVAGAAA